MLRVLYFDGIKSYLFLALTADDPAAALAANAESGWTTGQVIIAAIIGVATTTLVAILVVLTVRFITRRSLSQQSQDEGTPYMESRFFNGHAPFGHSPTNARFPTLSRPDSNELYESRELSYCSSNSSYILDHDAHI